MSLIAIFSDLHVHAYRDFARVLPNGRNSRLQNGVDVLTRVRGYCKEHDIDTVLFGGDLFHKKGTLALATYNPVYDAVRKFEKDDIDLYVVPGNHDQATLDGKLHAMKALGAVSWVMDAVVRQPLNRHKDIKVAFVPYIENAKEFRKALKSMAPADILIAHGAINGAVSGPVEYRPPEEVEVGDVPEDFGFRFFGHYHKRQKMAERFWFIGSPQQHSRGEREEEDKGFLVYNTETRKFKVVPLGYPMFKTVDLTSGKLPDNLTLVKGNYVDVEYDPDKNDPLKLEEEFLAIGAAAVNTIPVVQQKKSTTQRLEVDPSLSHRELTERYVKKYNTDPELDSDTLTSLAADYLEKAEQ